MKSQKSPWPHRRGIQKIINYKGVAYRIHIGKACDLVNGRGWFVLAIRLEYCSGGYLTDYLYDSGFSVSRSKFAAVRNAINNVEYFNIKKK